MFYNTPGAQVNSNDAQKSQHGKPENQKKRQSQKSKTPSFPRSR